MSAGEARFVHLNPAKSFAATAALTVDVSGSRVWGLGTRVEGIRSRGLLDIGFRA